VKWWIDASFGVHSDMRSHTGGVLTLAAYATSTKQKLTTKSSTEAELVGVNDVLSQVLWTRHFLDAQGYGVTDSTVYQDNQSAMLLENNGCASSSKHTRHINIRFFFVHEEVKNQEITIKCCPTKEMLADFVTKPLQGTPFQTVRDIIMNVDAVINLMQDHKSVLNEPEPEWKVVTHKRKKDRRSKVKGGDAADMHGSAVTSTAHKFFLITFVNTRCTLSLLFLISCDTSYNSRKHLQHRMSYDRTSVRYGFTCIKVGAGQDTANRAEVCF
jgi:hypothetical protein